MRKFLTVIVALCLIYFVVGWVSIHFKWLSESDYFLYAGIIGAVASVVGLISFIFPPLQRIDLNHLELESLQSVTAMTERIQKLTQQKAKTEGEIEDLDVRKQEMEILVRKASFSLFLQEKLSYHETQLLDLIRDNNELSRHLEEVQDIREKLTVLNEEIQLDPNVTLLEEIIVAASQRQNSKDDILASLPNSIQIVFSVLRLLGADIDFGTTRRR